MARKILSAFESETLYLMADIMRNMAHVDGYTDPAVADDYEPNIINDYIRYGSSALQAYREHKALKNPPTDLRDFIMSVMAHADGYVDYGAAVKHKKHLQDAYSRYSLAAVISIRCYERKPVRIEMTTEEPPVKKATNKHKHYPDAKNEQ